MKKRSHLLKSQGVLLKKKKKNMMKVSDPVIFGHAVAGFTTRQQQQLFV
ncbi:NADP-dependent isocitrate dehydrogenase [Vibrio lentus]|nr:NADP-dependent isocitrate dehydrogenase [Vibrio lentus]